MEGEQEQALTEKMGRIGYPDFETKPGEDEIPMLHVQDCLICGVEYALALSDEQLQALIDETVQAAGGQA